MLDDLFNISSGDEFDRACIERFQCQYETIGVYRQYVDLLGLVPNQVVKLDQIPFLPISFFKSHQIISDKKSAELVFSSSGSSGMSASQHYVADLDLYKKSFVKSFEVFYGSPSDYCFLALLPSYLEREGSSLIYMMDEFITQSKFPQSGFYLDELDSSSKRTITF